MTVFKHDTYKTELHILNAPEQIKIVSNIFKSIGKRFNCENRIKKKKTKNDRTDNIDSTKTIRNKQLTPNEIDIKTVHNRL